jgi:hypothetical protein
VGRRGLCPRADALASQSSSAASGLWVTAQALAKLAEHICKALGQLDVANRLQRINDDVEFGWSDDQMETIAVHIEKQLMTVIVVVRIFGWHGGRELSRSAMRTRLRGGQIAVVDGYPDPGPLAAQSGPRRKNSVRLSAD